MSKTLPDPRLNKRHRDQLRAQVAADSRRHHAGQVICVFCEQPINMGLVWPHPQSYVVHHAAPIAKGGKMFQHTAGAAHNRCNREAGDDTRHVLGVNSQCW